MNVYYWRMLMLDVLCWISPPQPYENLLCQYLKKSYLIHIIIHSKYFPNSDWRKAHV